MSEHPAKYELRSLLAAFPSGLTKLETILLRWLPERFVPKRIKAKAAKISEFMGHFVKVQPVLVNTGATVNWIQRNRAR